MIYKNSKNFCKHLTIFCLTTFLCGCPGLKEPLKAEETIDVSLEHLYTEHRPWGSFTILDEGENYKVKRIIVLPGKRLSLQKHFHRSEHWVIVQGSAWVTVGDQEKEMQVNEQVFIPVEQLHRIHNQGTIPLIFIETQCGDYLGEDDIVRYSDDFGRVNP